jgi:AP-1 complex subunit gamma-1
MGGGLGDLGGLLAPTAPAPAAAQAPPAAPSSSSFPSAVAFQNSALRIVFDFSKGSDPSNTAVRATFQNGSASPLTDFVFQAAVPKYLTMQLQPASGTVIAPSGSIQQQLRLTNSLHGQKPLLMKLKIEYMQNGQRVSEMSSMSNFPEALWK